MRGVLRLRSRDRFHALLERQSAIAHEAAVALAGLASGEPPSEIAENVGEIERQGDAVVRELEESIAKTFVTSIDREDLQRLAQEIDDVTDEINLVARYFHLYGVKELTEPMGLLIEVLVEATERLRDGLPSLHERAWPALMDVGRSLRALKKRGSTIFQDGMRALFDDDSLAPNDLLRQKEIIEDLEAALDRCERVGNTLGHFSIKHG